MKGNPIALAAVFALAAVGGCTMEREKREKREQEERERAYQEMLATPEWARKGVKREDDPNLPGSSLRTFSTPFFRGPDLELAGWNTGWKAVSKLTTDTHLVLAYLSAKLLAVDFYSMHGTSFREAVTPGGRRVRLLAGPRTAIPSSSISGRGMTSYRERYVISLTKVFDGDPEPPEVRTGENLDIRLIGDKGCFEMVIPATYVDGVAAGLRENGVTVRWLKTE